jgi:hypothetical protein
MFRLFIATSTIVMALGVAPALAGKGGNGQNSQGGATPSIRPNQADPTYGSVVTFALTYPDLRWPVLVNVTCTQNGTRVYNTTQASDGSSGWSPAFGLWSSGWAAAGGGSADCTAKLFYYTWRGQVETGVTYLAQTQFTASG